MSNATAARVWADLNSRQQKTITVIYAADIHAELIQAQRQQQGKLLQPATVWRWLEYGELSRGGVYDGTLQGRLRLRGLLDSGTGAVLGTLSRRHLIERRYTAANAAVTKLHIQITDAGRAAVHASGNGGPQQVLSAQLWAALLKVTHRANGIHHQPDPGAWAALAELEPPLVTIARDQWDTEIRLTEAGRAYVRNWREWYVGLHPGASA